MTRFAGIYGQWNEHWGNYTFKGLDVAADYFNVPWQGQKHRALPDAQMTKAVWDAMDSLAVFGDASTGDAPAQLPVSFEFLSHLSHMQSLKTKCFLRRITINACFLMLHLLVLPL